MILLTPLNNNRNKLLNDICEQVQDGMDKFHLLQSKDIVIGFSGGKDSTLLCIVLKELGYNVYPVMVNLGYSENDLEGFKNSYKNKGITFEILNINNKSNDISLYSNEKIKDLINSLYYDKSNAPCTFCSQIRHIALSNYASIMNINYISYGHHKEDFITTVLKDYYIYLYYKKYGKYDVEKFICFVNDNEPDFTLINSMISLQIVGTMSMKLQDNKTNTKLIRPFVFVSECQITKCIKQLGLKPLPYSCFLQNYTNPRQQTKREIVHNKTRSLCLDKSIAEQLTKLTFKCLNDEGVSTYNPRSNRQATLPGFEVKNNDK